MFQRRAAESLANGKGYSISAMMSGGSPVFQELSYGQTQARHQEQYAHFTGWCYAAIKCIAHRLAGQKIKMGRKVEEPSIVSWQYDRPPGRKLHLADKLKSTSMVVKSIDSDIEQIENHPVLDALARPNSIMTGWSLIFSTVASIELTGISYWWFVKGEEDQLQIWPLPAHWVTPIHDSNKRLFAYYRIRPTGIVGEGITVPHDEVARFSLPDPANPTGVVSPLQTQAPAVATDESIQVAQHRYFKNGIFPGVIIRAGRLPSMTGIGEGDRPYMTGPQRRELFTAIKAMYQGVTNYNEPLIVDRLIEGIEKFTQTGQEMDFLNSGAAVKSRIFQAFGVSPVVAGEIVGVNRATAAAADRIFVDNVINPLATMIGEVMTAYIGEEGTYFWFEIAKANDAEQSLREAQFAAQYGCLTVNEIRQNIMGLAPWDDGDKVATSGGGAGFGGLGILGGSPPAEKPESKPQAESDSTPASETSNSDSGDTMIPEQANVPPTSLEPQDQTTGERRAKPRRK
jgi:phage portal protein BeeE